MVTDQSRTFPPCSYVSNSETQADVSQQEAAPRRRHCGNAATPTIMSRSTRPLPGRRKSKTSQRSPAIGAVRSLRFTKWLSSNAGLFLLTVWCFITLCGPVVADPRRPSLDKLARRNGLLVDLSDHPEPALFRPMERRDSGDDGSASSSTSYAPIQASMATTLSTGSPTAALTTAPPNASPTVLPQVFDSNIGNNFTSTTCPTFFNKLVTDADFQQCYPLSLLLTVSHYQKSMLANKIH